MSSDGTFATVVAASMLLFLGALVAFYGYRLFWIILPIWGFFFGLAIGAQGVSALRRRVPVDRAELGGRVLHGVAVRGVVLPVLVHRGGADGGYIGYGLVVGLFGLFGVDLGPLVWILGVAAG
jgi:hypothetical protein